MTQHKFILIEKKIVCIGGSALFSIYSSIGSGSDMECILEKDGTLTPKIRELMQSKTSLFIEEKDKEAYQDYYDEHMAGSSKNKHDIASAKIYVKATNVIDELYKNPETLGGYEKSKEVVSDLVSTILHDEFTIRSLMRIATHDYYTHTHSLNVSVYALSLGAFLKMPKEDLSALGEAGLLHDLGKSKISVEVINKNGALTDDEFSKMKKHPELGFHLAKQMGITNKRILYGIRHHHEKMDGSGYPSGLQGESIPLFARIIGLCDIFDALTSKRSYKEAMSTFDALRLIKTDMHNHVDLKLLNEMIKMFK